MASASPDFLDHVPAQKPPEGQTSNLVDPSSKAQALTTIDAVFVSLMLLAVLVRVFVRTKLAKVWGWDDASCGIAALGSLAHAILYTQMTKIGFGRHLWDIPASWLIKQSNVQLMSANGVTYPITIFFAKLSILLLYIRIFSINRTLRNVIYATATVMALFYLLMVGFGIGSIIKCTGVASAGTRFCKTISGPIVLVNGSFGVVSDFVVLSLPFPLLAKLQLRPRKKIGLGAVFAAGLAACATSLARLISFAVNYKSSDVFWVQASTSMYTAVEINIGIIVACVSCFPLFYNHSKEYLSSTTTTIRQRLLTSKGTPPHTEKGTSAVTLARAHTGSTEGGHQFVELQHPLPPKNSHPNFHAYPQNQVWSVDTSAGPVWVYHYDR